jgi:enoyl-CoA hydratase
VSENGRDPVTVERAGDVLVLTIDRERKSNALDRRAFGALARAVAEAASSEVRAVVITAAGDRAFSAGADVGELATMQGPSARELVRRGQEIFGAIEDLPQPTLAAINGAALGGGLELAMACDLRVAAEHASFGLPEITLGNVPGWGATQRLPRLVGHGRASEMLLTGKRISARQAREWGLVNAVVPSESVREAALRIAAQIARHAPLALEHAKRALRVGRQEGFDAGLEAELEAVEACSGTAEQRGAVEEFLSRRHQ